MGICLESISFNDNQGTIFLNSVTNKQADFTQIFGIDNLQSFSKKIGAI